MGLLCLLLLSLHILHTEAAVGGHWCYQSQKQEEPECKDPQQWYQVDATCKGSKQSPINIVTKNVVHDRSLKPLSFEGYHVKQSSKWHIENNGHTVKVALNASAKIGGGGLRRKYKAIEFHLHWGSQGVPQYLPGSEHSIDGEKQAMELHIVHIREDVSDVTEAKKHADGLAVLAFFVKAEEENKNYATLIDELENIRYKGQRAELESLPLSSLLPPEEELGRFYRYEGSLTTPDCYEGVIWTVFEKPVELSINQITQFSKVHYGVNSSSTLMAENFRPAQLLNQRQVSWASGSSSKLLPAAQLLLLLLLLPSSLSSL
ncbi:CAH4 anhydrase, partial [Bucco capensis]|nr:CAH4 anhydrase [Bucco capensis]